MKIFFILLLLLSYQTHGAIEDNSFLLEEAYNQKKDEYQFIHYYQSSKEGEQEYFFQLEAPLTHETHQLSFDFSYLRPSEIPEFTVSDTQLNYRYQAMKINEHMLTERLTLVIPTGSERYDSGSGEYAFSFMQSATFPLGERYMNHWNLGATIYPHATTGITAGTSIVYLYKDDLNFLAETLIETDHESDTSFYLNPGFRFALDGEKGQLVPGIAFPFQYTENKIFPGVFVYLSVEATLN